MKQATREWLRNLIVTKNNGKAIEIRDYIDELEKMLDSAIEWHYDDAVDGCTREEIRKHVRLRAGLKP